MLILYRRQFSYLFQTSSRKGVVPTYFECMNYGRVRNLFQISLITIEKRIKMRSHFTNPMGNFTTVHKNLLPKWNSNNSSINTMKEEIIEHLQKEYSISTDSLNMDFLMNKTNNSKLEIDTFGEIQETLIKDTKDIFRMSKVWSFFFKNDRDLYVVINSYLKREQNDQKLHRYLQLLQKETSKNIDWEENQNGKFQMNHVLLYLMAMYYKGMKDYNLISLLSEQLIKELKRKPDKYKNLSLLFSICEIYNSYNVMNEELFSLVFTMFNEIYLNDNKRKDCNLESIKRNIQIKKEELTVLLRTLYVQKYKNHDLVHTLLNYIKNISNIEIGLAVDVFFYVSLLAHMNSSLLVKMESILFYTQNTEAIGNTKIDQVNSWEEIKLCSNLSIEQCSKLLYAYFTLPDSNINWFIIHKILVVLCKEVKEKDPSDLEQIFKKDKQIHERICIIRNFLRYNQRNVYDKLSSEVKKVLRELYYIDIGEKKIKERIFVDKVSWHLKKLRIPHVKNVYKGGIIFDIIEKDKRLVWMCFSYHNYYVKTIDLTVEKFLHMNIIRAMNYKIASTHYYQFSRMKARKTRFEYLRMRRYYSLRDRRNFDNLYDGWSLPYINWYHRKNKNVHVSNYFYNYTPLSEIEY